MIIVNIDGPNGSGKTSLVNVLLEKLNKVCGYSVQYTHFPRYETEIGEVIRKSLFQEIEMESEALQMLYSADRLNFCKFEIPKFEKETDILLVDRYLTSGIVYGRQDGMTSERTVALQNTTRYPDLNIVLQCPLHVLMDRLNSKVCDKHETRSNVEKSIKLYKELAFHMPYASPVVYVDSNRDIMDIANEVIFLIKVLKGGYDYVSNLYSIHDARHNSNSE